VVHDPGHLGQVVGGHLGLRSDAPARGQHHTEVVVADPLPVHRVRPGEPGLAYLVDQCDVELAAGAQALDGLARLGHGDPQLDAQVLPCRVLQDPGEDVGGQGREDA
jgi:hypothetical protein